MARELAGRLGPAARLNEPMGRYTSYRIGGPADVFFIARGAHDLVNAVECAIDLGLPWRVIGSGSNVLVADEGVAGLVVKAANKNLRFTVCSTEDVLVHVEAGSLLASVARRTALDSLAGLEWAAAVPGTVGAAVVNNSGAFGSCAAEHLSEATLHFPLEGVRNVGPEELGMAYRTSRLKGGDWSAIVLSATFRVTQRDGASARARLAQFQTMRRKTQPAGASVGSMFKNPPGAHAGALIEQAGLKGYRLGDAEVSPIHANFVLNRGAARARHVLDLMQRVQEQVGQMTGISLEPEIELLGSFPQ